MQLALGQSTIFFDLLSVLSSLSLPKNLLRGVEQKAIERMEQVTLEIRGVLYTLHDVEPDEAKKALAELKPLTAYVSKVRQLAAEINDPDLGPLATAAMTLIEVLGELIERLAEAASVHSAYVASMPVLAQDWDDPENDHWDNY